MKVTLAVEYEGKKPDTTIDVEDHIGKQLINVGKARVPADAKPDAETKAADKVAAEVAKKAAEAEANAYTATAPEPNTETA